jgi:hypothetical protein
MLLKSKTKAEATLTQAIQTATALQRDSQALQTDLKHSRQAVYWGYALTFLGGVITTACLMWLALYTEIKGGSHHDHDA